MSFRYWLADLISGGKLSQMKRDGSVLLSAMTTGQARQRQMRQESRELQGKLSILEMDNRNSWSNSKLYADRLYRIAALETDYANATVRKMAKIARGEM